MQLLESGDFNLGLIDIEMPRKSGLEVLREMRARKDEKANMTLLALTAYVLPEHKDRITAAGADGIIAKPLTDLATFGNAILIFTGEVKPEISVPHHANPDAEIQPEIYNGLKEIIGNDSMLELLSKVQSDLEEVCAGLLKGASELDIVPIRAQTHILISIAGAIGAVNLQHIAEKLNATAKSENWDEISPDTAKCEAAVRAVLGFVVQELNS
jgi:CheY-like chemotaxis protein